MSMRDADPRPSLPWVTVSLIPALRTSSDPTPKEGAIPAVLRIVEAGFDVKIVTERASTLGGKKMTEEWILCHDLPPFDVVNPMAVAALKGAIRVDDLDYLLLFADNLAFATATPRPGG